MNSILSEHWELLALRGALAVVFGILALAWPGITLIALVFLFGAYVLVEGIATLVMAFTRGTRESRRVTVVLGGILDILAGVVAFAYPGLSAVALLFVIAAWAIITGIVEIVTAVELRRAITGEAWYILGGALSIVFGLLLFASPGAGLLTVAWLVGIWAIAFGIALLVLAFRVRHPRHLHA